ncbi:MAG: hypothetical protein P4L64_02140 [Caulobacteraceae bacterium]|nr:hypothetical protein [Caulobacteraceae bacterium]
MALPKIDLEGMPIPSVDGAVNTYSHPEAKASKYFNESRKVLFVNGMKNSGEDHAISALALSWVQMCPVIGVYNQSVSGWADFKQCIADKDQFNGPLSFSAQTTVGLRTLFTNQTSVEAARRALSRNRAQVSMFDQLRLRSNRRCEIFAHSQGNLILSNALQAVVAVDGPQAVAGRVVNTFGSPSVNWPPGIIKREHGFTFDPVTWLAGFDSTWEISKVGMPKDSSNPITHAFLEYLDCDPAFVVNRYRWGGLGVTFSMDEEGLAKCLAQMGGNLGRVRSIFEYLEENHSSDSDDVALAYVDLVKKDPALARAIKFEPPLRNLLIKLLNAGWTSDDEQAAIDYLKAL